LRVFSSAQRLPARKRRRHRDLHIHARQFRRHRRQLTASDYVSIRIVHPHIRSDRSGERSNHRHHREFVDQRNRYRLSDRLLGVSSCIARRPLYISIGDIFGGTNYIYGNRNEFVLFLRFPDPSNLDNAELNVCNAPGFTCGNYTGTETVHQWLRSGWHGFNMVRDRADHHPCSA
jgi:hypothetical protein